MSTAPFARPALPVPSSPVRGRWPAVLLLGAAFAGTVGLDPVTALAQTRSRADGLAPSCYRTGGGTLEICRDGSEAEGVFAVTRSCVFARDVQLVRLPRNAGAGPIQAVYQGESPLTGQRKGEECPERRGTDPRDGGTLRTGRSPEQLALTMPPAPVRFGVTLPERRESRRRGEAPAVTAEGIGPRSPLAISGRDWAGEEYFYVFMLGQEPVAGGPPAGEEPPRRGSRSRRSAEEPQEDNLRRRVQIEARTLDFARFEIRTRTETGTAWTPVDDGGGGGRRQAAPVPAPVRDEAGQPIASACAAASFDTQGLAGSISIVDRTYHYFYTDVLPEDCSLPPGKRRMGLFLRTSQDLAADRVWSAPRRLGGALPPGSLVRVARSRDTKSWAVAYSCYRPANAPGGPVADICLQYTADLDPAGIGGLTLYSEPLEAARSSAYLGLRSGGDGGGRFDRSAFSWMTDAYGNLDVPASYAGKSGLLTWVDRFAPGPGGAEGSRIYGRPVYWGTWTVRRTGSP